MLERIQAAPADPILGLTEAFKQDPNPKKVNLGVGVYKDANGKTPVLNSVKKAEERILKSADSKSYMPINGDPQYALHAQRMLFGADHEIIASNRARTAHTPGGTGALRVAGDFIHTQLPGARVWISDPTWANHKGIFEAAGLETVAYPYYDAANQRLDFEGMIAALKQIPKGDMVLLHGCCHNPTGMDPTQEQWKQIAATLSEGGAMPLIDFAYQGLAAGMEEDAAGLREFLTAGCELLICSSFSKNFGLYQDRVGALTLVAADSAAADSAFSQIKRVIRVNYSNPPAHGGLIVREILSDKQLHQEWLGELKEMRDRINLMRRRFVDALKEKGVERDFSFITRQNGMFSFSGLNRDQVDQLREKYAIYIVGSGRINVAGMTEANMDYLTQAIAGVL
ncbi:aspartate/tyrosine/aromatic aminotransferase [Candidatus Sumerlaeota bacterium]|nr:aspartate/tyrosine/aromatic aminotransferase [Candidatus Sumerlaeota bacterium]